MRRYSIPLLIGMVVLLWKCKKIDQSGPVLPEPTQQGKNVLGFKLNRAIWLPNIQCQYFANPCGGLRMTAIPVNGFDSLPLGISITAGRKVDGVGSYLQIVSKGINNPPATFLSKTG